MIGDGDLIYHSKWGTFKNFLSGSATLDIGGNVTSGQLRVWTTTIAHNKNKVLPFQGYFKNGTVWRMAPNFVDTGVDGAPRVANCYLTADANNVYLNVALQNVSGVTVTMSNQTVQFRYFAFRD